MEDAMWSTAEIIKARNDEYPCLKRSHNGDVVLFYAPRCGIKIHSDNPRTAPGHHATDWAEEQVFFPFNGYVTIHSD